MKYIIPELSAHSIISAAQKTDKGWQFCFDTTDPSKAYLVEKAQQDDFSINKRFVYPSRTIFLVNPFENNT
jgi:hypothetical protein